MVKIDSVNSLGVEFRYHGDSVIWLWPWKRSNGKPWLSISFESSFRHLYEIDEMWGGYFEALRNKSGIAKTPE